ncbi:MAG: hypothetical protein WKF48_13765 [Solirubrobacteraceae bacterium]
MSGSTRILAVAGTIVIRVIAFVVLSPRDDEPATTAGATRTQTSAPPAATTAPAPEAAAQPRFQTIRVREGKPVGGIEKIELAKGERARIQVTSPDTSDEIHLHGYDLDRDVKPGAPARFSFQADAEGIFEIELHGNGTQLAELVVKPS